MKKKLKIFRETDFIFWFFIVNCLITFDGASNNEQKIYPSIKHVWFSYQHRAIIFYFFFTLLSQNVKHENFPILEKYKSFSFTSSFVLYQGFHFLYTPQSNKYERIMLCTYVYDEKHISCLKQQQQHVMDLFSLYSLFSILSVIRCVWAVQ